MNKNQDIRSTFADYNTSWTQARERIERINKKLLQFDKKDFKVDLIFLEALIEQASTDADIFLDEAVYREDVIFIMKYKKWINSWVKRAKEFKTQLKNM